MTKAAAGAVTIGGSTRTSAAAAAVPQKEGGGQALLSAFEDAVVAPFLNGVNWWVHQPWVSDVVHAAYWSGALVLGAPLLGLGVWLVLLYHWAVGNLSQRTRSPEGRGAVLVTGCDRGFGRDLAVQLAKQGWKVYAACLTESGVASLEQQEEEASGGGRVVACQVDVTVETQVKALVARIEQQEEGGLYCLVNNAGVGTGYVVDWMTMDQIRSVFEVNFFAVVHMVKCCLPSLKRAALAGQGPRIVNMVSYAGLVPAPALFGAYGASKHAADAFSNALMQELAPFGIQVCTLNPTFHATHIVHTYADGLRRGYEELDEAKRQEYGPQYHHSLTDALDNGSRLYRWDPALVVRALVHAVTAERCRQQYIVGMDGRFVLPVLCMLPRPITNWVISASMPWAYIKPAAVVAALAHDHDDKKKASSKAMKRQPEVNKKAVITTVIAASSPSPLLVPAAGAAVAGRVPPSDHPNSTSSCDSSSPVVPTGPGAAPTAAADLTHDDDDEGDEEEERQEQ